jgi:hypothetical protein
MRELPQMPKKPVTPDNAPRHTTDKTSPGGGNVYNQMVVGRDFAVHDPIPGHTQKQNVKIP